MTPALLSVRDAATYLAVSPRTIRDLIADGIFTARTIGAGAKIRVAELDGYLDQLFADVPSSARQTEPSAPQSAPRVEQTAVATLGHIPRPGVRLRATDADTTTVAHQT